VGEPSLVDALEEIALGSVAVTNTALARAGGQALSFEQWRALVVLGETSEGIRISAVAREVGVTLPATSRLLQRLARRGLVSFEPDPADSRATITRLTPDGLALRRAVLAFRRRRLAEIAAMASVPEELAPVVARLAAAFREPL
jgi:DNA-binding MarR family transcriptional regulator